MKTYTLLGPNGSYTSKSPGTLGGHKKQRVYGKLDCPSALRAIRSGGYTKWRVFFADKQVAIQCGYRPCGVCMPSDYLQWRQEEKTPMTSAGKGKQGRSQHKTEKRECPVCHETKVFPVRNETCGPECANLLNKQRTGKPPEGEQHDISGNSWTVSIPRTRIHTLEQLLEYCEVDLSTWEVEKFTVTKLEGWRKDKSADIKWTGGVMDGELHDSGRIHIEPLYNVKAFLRRKVEVITVRDEIAALKKFALETAPKFKPIKRPKRATSGNMLEMSVPDLHLGKLAWGKETGWGDYDVKIAERLYEQAVENLIERTSAYKFDEVCLVIGNDLLQVNNPDNTTAAGTVVDADTRYHKMFEIARIMTTRSIERLRELAPVRVIVVPGNHDRLSAWHLGDSLTCYFHNYKDVTIENDPTPRKYMRWGSVMLMWSHEAAIKRLRDDYPLLMATEQPEMFGLTRFHEVHLGDIHQVRLEEQHGVRVRVLPSLCPPDEWHNSKGFVGNIPSAECFIWNRVEGLVGTATYSVPL